MSLIDLIHSFHVTEAEYLSELMPKEVVLIFGVLRTPFLALCVLFKC